jgi:hypothetical protein
MIERSRVGKHGSALSMKEEAVRAVVAQQDRHKGQQEVATEADRHKPPKEEVAAELLRQAPRRSRLQRR